MQNCHLESLLSLSFCLIYFDVSCTCDTLTHRLATEIIRKNAEKEREREEVEERRKKIEIKNGDMTGARFAHVENEGKPRRQETEQTEGQNEGQTDRRRQKDTQTERQAVIEKPKQKWKTAGN